ncbi:MAG: DUF488 domain-containing protein [Planctomycetota bacterium]|jgi:uncharacterized protein (DUF488 family)
MRDSLLTIGYQGRTIREFAKAIKALNVDVLVDVRERPLSRKRGFSKTSLRMLLKRLGKSYVHLRVLGSPPSLRAKLQRDGDYRSFFREYVALMDTPERAAGLAAVGSFLTEGKSVCLMCFERDASNCHRSVIADAMKSHFPEMDVVNL